MIINTKFELGDIVYLKTDVDQLPRIITTIEIKQNHLRYGLTNIVIESYHYDYEISITKNIILATSN